MTDARPALLLTATTLATALRDPDLAARVVLDFNPRARRMSLRVDPIAGRVVLVRPPRVSDRTVMAFVASRADWIAKHLENLEPQVSFSDGAVIPFQGAAHTIRFEGARGAVSRNADQAVIIVPGRIEHAPRRLRDWLKLEARKALTPQIYAMAKTLEVNVAHIGVRDTRSRWGSATPGGRLSFSWRLILAPEEVLTYVVAHEVAHLRHMNHGPAFWRTVESLWTTTGSGEVGLAREWLRRGGTALHRYG